MMAAAATPAAQTVELPYDYITFYPDELLLKFPARTDHPQFQCSVAVNASPSKPGRWRGRRNSNEEERRRLTQQRLAELNEKIHEGLELISNDRRGIKQPLLPQQPAEYPPARFTFGGPASRCFTQPDPAWPGVRDPTSPLNQAIQLQRKMTRLTRETWQSMTYLLLGSYHLKYSGAMALAQETMDELMKLVEQHAVADRSTTSSTT